MAKNDPRLMAPELERKVIENLQRAENKSAILNDNFINERLPSFGFLDEHVITGRYLFPSAFNYLTNFVH